MTQPQLRDLVKASNPVVTHQLLPDQRAIRTLYVEAMQRAGNPQPSVDLLEQAVERRREMQTQERPIEIVREKKASQPPRRLIPALVGALAVLVIAVGVWAVTRTSEPDFADRSPLEVTGLFDQGIVTADWSGTTAYFTADATYQFIFDGQEIMRSFFDELPESAPVVDWDGDGSVTEMDGFIALGADVYAGGVTTLLSCSQPDAATAVCREVREGYAFKNPTHSADWTFTFADGLIDNIVIDVADEGTDFSALRSYGLWVQQNRPELAVGLINEFSGEWILSPETIDTHRELVAEWVAQR